MQKVKRYDMCDFGGGLVSREDGAWYHMDDYDALAQQLAASQARYERMFEQSEKTLSRVHMMYAKRLLEATGERQDVLFPDEEMIKWFEQIKEQQATITRLEAMTCKALQQDFEYRKQIAEAVGLLRDLRGETAYEARDRIDAYLAAHEGKENDH